MDVINVVNAWACECIFGQVSDKRLLPLSCPCRYAGHIPTWSCLSCCQDAGRSFNWLLPAASRVSAVSCPTAARKPAASSITIAVCCSSRSCCSKMYKVAKLDVNHVWIRVCHMTSCVSFGRVKDANIPNAMSSTMLQRRVLVTTSSSVSLHLQLQVSKRPQLLICSVNRVKHTPAPCVLHRWLGHTCFSFSTCANTAKP
jgi:hypothetical protein